METRAKSTDGANAAVLLKTLRAAMKPGKPGTDGTPYVAKNTFVIPSDEAGVKAADIVRQFLSEMLLLLALN